MNVSKWRFPKSNHGERKGISSGDIETFRKYPFQSFAREILQNSIDARSSDEEPVSVVFKEFDIKTCYIPGYQDLKDAIRRCREFWSYKDEYVNEYNKMMGKLEEESIHCLRVSDYNTTGLIGVNTSKTESNNFLALTKGTGVSEKSGTVAGGSKGVGKNAAFLMSDIRTVFYSTNANKDLNGDLGSFLGSIGVAEFVSGYIDDTHNENSDYTQGTGYYSRDDFNNPLEGLIDFDSATKERVIKPGTDIFIIGFSGKGQWEKEVINSILDSFMSTIVRGELKVEINNKVIDKDTISSIVYDDFLILKKQKANIISQYRLLKGGNDVRVFDIETDYGNCELYILLLKKEEEDLATHKCSMIRYPLMKIKDEPVGQGFRISSMCIIDNGNLGKRLRDIENPQHIDWEPNRIDDVSIRNEMKAILKSIKDQIRQRIIECLKIGNSEPLDPNGAGDFLPDLENFSNENSSNEGFVNDEKILISKRKENVFLEKNPRDENKDSLSVEPIIGGIGDDDTDEEIYINEGHNRGRGGPSHPGKEEKGKSEDDDEVFKKTQLSGVKYKVMCTNKSEGKIRIIFIAPDTLDNCYLSIFKLDDSNIKTPVLILEMFCNGEKIISNDKKEYGPFNIVENKKIILDIHSETRGYYGSEVKIICK